ncbi:MAG: STAS domain-containing protein [Magnetococcus sp. WYHC-3]
MTDVESSGGVRAFELQETGAHIRLSCRHEPEFSDVRVFENLLARLPASGPVEIDMSRLDYLGSRSLGVFLVMLNKVQPRERGVSLLGCRPGVRKIIATAGLDRLFRVTP